MSRATTEEQNEQFYQESMDSAFPFSYEMDGVTFTVRGLTKREYFAAMAMQGILSNFAAKNLDAKDVSSEALFHANSLIKELEDNKDEN